MKLEVNKKKTQGVNINLYNIYKFMKIELREILKKHSKSETYFKIIKRDYKHSDYFDITYSEEPINKAII